MSQSYRAALGCLALALMTAPAWLGCRSVAADPAPAEAGEPVAKSAAATGPEAFLQSKRAGWFSNSVPFEDGQVLHDMVVDNDVTSILEIGTSQGHSTIWLAWAASKTGGKVTTIEIDPTLHAEAKANLEAAGVIEHVELILGDAHEVVPSLEGEFGFVFSDADKDWYIQYFEDIRDNIPAGGCIAAHNALNGFAGVDRYIEYVRTQPEFETKIVESSPSGFAISCKQK